MIEKYIMNDCTDNLLKPTDGEHGYSEGWKGFHIGSTLKSNPYSEDTETQLYEGYVDGWRSAKLEDSSDV